MLPDDNTGSNDAVSRIRPDDELVTRSAVQQIFGGISVSAIYDDPDLMRLKVNVMANEQRSRAVRWILREIRELRARRVARGEERAAAARAQIEKRHERRKQRANAAA